MRSSRNSFIISAPRIWVGVCTVAAQRSLANDDDDDDDGGGDDDDGDDDITQLINSLDFLVKDSTELRELTSISISTTNNTTTTSTVQLSISIKQW